MIVAAVPLKALSQAKSRLAGRLDPDRRARLAKELAERTIAVLRRCNQIERVALATAETGLAERLGLQLVPDRGSLNQAVADSMEWACELGADALLVAPADLPYLEPRDIERVLAARLPAPSVVVAGTGDGGTGALLLSPPSAIKPRFGDHSFRRHVGEAAAQGIRVVTVASRGFEVDLDTHQELDEYLARSELNGRSLAL